MKIWNLFYIRDMIFVQYFTLADCPKNINIFQKLMNFFSLSMFSICSNLWICLDQIQMIFLKLCSKAPSQRAFLELHQLLFKKWVNCTRPIRALLKTFPPVNYLFIDHLPLIENWVEKRKNTGKLKNIDIKAFISLCLNKLNIWTS